MPLVASHALLFVSCWTLCWSAAPQTSTWRIKTNQGVIEYDTVTSVSSDMMCVRECGQRPPCESCAYDRVSGACYLQVDSGALTAKSTDTVTPFSAACRVSEAPIDRATVNATWKRTETGFEGDLGCFDDDYMYVGDSPTLTCSGPGPWSFNNAECRQRIWRTRGEKFTHHPVPKTPEAGWTVCLQGTPTNTLVLIEMYDDKKDRVVQLSCRINKDLFLITSSINNVFDVTPTKVTVEPFPLIRGLPFDMRIVASTLTTLQLYIGKTMYANYTTPVLPLSDIVTVGLTQLLNMTFLDLWC